jgi:tight adherence protein B
MRTLTAQSRACATIVSALPLVVLGIFTLIRPEYARPLFYHPLGIRMLEMAILLDVTALIIMRRIARVEY